MTATVRETIPALLRSAGYLACWTSELTSRGDFEGRQYAIEIFNVPANEQREVRRRLRGLRRIVEGILGEPILFIFHTPQATEKHYGDVVASLSRIENAVLRSPLIIKISGDLSRPFPTHIQPRFKIALEPAA